MEFGTFLKKKNTTEVKFRPLGLNRDFFWDHFWTFPGLLVVIFIKMLLSLQKANKKHVNAMFNAKLGLFDDHCWTFIPNLHEQKTETQPLGFFNGQLI